MVYQLKTIKTCYGPLCVKKDGSGTVHPREAFMQVLARYTEEQVRYAPHLKVGQPYRWGGALKAHCEDCREVLDQQRKAKGAEYRSEYDKRQDRIEKRRKYQREYQKRKYDAAKAARSIPPSDATD